MPGAVTLFVAPARQTRHCFVLGRFISYFVISLRGKAQANNSPLTLPCTTFAVLSICFSSEQRLPIPQAKRICTHGEAIRPASECIVHSGGKVEKTASSLVVLKDGPGSFLMKNSIYEKHLLFSEEIERCVVWGMCCKWRMRAVRDGGENRNRNRRWIEGRSLCCRLL